MLISVARCRCNLSHGNDNIPRTKLIHQCRCKPSLYIRYICILDYIIYLSIYLSNCLFNLVFACAFVSLFVLFIWIFWSHGVDTFHIQQIYKYTYTLYTCVYMYMFGCHCMPPRCVCATWQSHYILSAPCAVSRSCFHMKELSLARYISLQDGDGHSFTHSTHTHAQYTHTRLCSPQYVICSLRQQLEIQIETRQTSM